MVATKSEAPARKRGRPRKEDQAAKPDTFSGGLVETLRNDLRRIVGVCETCGHTINPIQPVANEIGVSPIVFAKFIRGDAGVSMDTFDRMWGYAQAHPNEAPTVATAEADAEAEPVAAGA